MGDHGGYFGCYLSTPSPPKIGKPKRDRSKIKAARKSARRR